MFIFLILSLSSAQSCGECCQILPPRPYSYTYTYYQDSGRLTGGGGSFYINTYGYSGNNTDGIMGRNNPSDQCTKNIGPAPATLYKLGPCSDLMHVNTTRPCSFPMSPLNQTEMCGRSGIWLHGCQCCEPDSPKCDYSIPPCGTCSEGCIVISRNYREKLRTGDLIQVEHHDPQGLLFADN